MKEATTLVVSLPKVGKSRLLCQFIGRLHRGESEFLGQKLFGPCPPVLIVGSDQEKVIGLNVSTLLACFQTVSWLIASSPSTTRDDHYISITLALRPSLITPASIQGS